MPIAVGDQAPQFKAKDQDGVERCPADLGGKPLVLFFYPKDDTPGCTIEACGFRDQYAALQALGAEVWGVSGDGASSHRRLPASSSCPIRCWWMRAMPYATPSVLPRPCLSSQVA